MHKKLCIFKITCYYIFKWSRQITKSNALKKGFQIKVPRKLLENMLDFVWSYYKPGYLAPLTWNFWLSCTVYKRCSKLFNNGRPFPTRKINRYDQVLTDIAANIPISKAQRKLLFIHILSVYTMELLDLPLANTHTIKKHSRFFIKGDFLKLS